MEPILSVNGLKTYYYSQKMTVAAVDGVDFTLEKGRVLGIVGESGCGKSTVARSLVGLLDGANAKTIAGTVMFDGKDILKMNVEELRQIRGKRISMIFQDPFVSLNPVYTIKNQIYEILKVHENLPKSEADQRVLELLRMVGIPHPEQRMNSYPYQLSGGMQQRVMIAIALACKPDILLADEPTTALDVTVQAQILDLITQLKEDHSMGIILISHNMGLVAEMCDDMLVMYGGVVVEEGTCEQIFANPRHPYTIGLLDSIPSVVVDKEELSSIPGVVPKLTPPVKGCRFASRCSHATDRCREQEPPIFKDNEGHGSRCWLHEKAEKEDSCHEW